MQDIKFLRGQIDIIDRQIVSLFQQRMEISESIAEYKIAHDMPVLDAQREREVMEEKISLVADPALKRDVSHLYENIMCLSRNCQRRVMKRQQRGELEPVFDLSRIRQPVEHPVVAYQGMPGAYSEEAAVRFFGPDVESRGLDHFEDVFQAVEKGKVDYGILPIENSSTGSIRQTCDLLAEYRQYIVGETAVKVEHCLCVVPGAGMDTITHVYSHEQGLFQSDRFLAQHPQWVQVPQLDTAGSARYVAQQGDVTKAAICSRRAAELYGLKILAAHTNHNDTNDTRFAVISAVPELRLGSDKISALFTLPHQSGSLHEVLTIFAVHGLNMVKLESRPLPGHSWEYLFFVEFTGSLTNTGMDGVLRELEQSTADFRLLGNYKANLETQA